MEWNNVTLEPAIKEEILEFTDEDPSFWNAKFSPDCEDNAHYIEDFKESQHIEMVDAKIPLASSIRNRIVFEDDEIFKLLAKQELLNNNKNEELYEHIKEEVKDDSYEVNVKIESLEEQEVKNGVEDIGVHYDDLVTASQAKCKFCHRLFRNNFNLLRHKIEHMQLNIEDIGLLLEQVDKTAKKLNSSTVSKRSEQYKCTKCHKGFRKSDSLQEHFSNVHIAGEYICDICKKMFNSKRYLKNHMRNVHNRKQLPGKKIYSDVEVKCKECNAVFSHPSNFRLHIKNCHANEKHTCEICNAVFKCKPYYRQHMKRVHYDYGRTFGCWCGKQCRTPKALYAHSRYSKHARKPKEELSINTN